jgi:tRNA (adenine57-N1/adenine58-N1)-methyltransferase
MNLMKMENNKKTTKKKESDRLFISKSSRKFFSKADSDLHTQYGMLKKEDYEKANFGDELKTNKDISLFMVEPSYVDYYHKIKRLAQIIPLKDIGSIITETGINKNSVVLDSGSGSGGLCCFLAKIVKKMYTYDIRDDHIELVKKNKEFLGLSNLDINKGSIYESDKIKKKDMDVMILDVPEPWNAIETGKKILKAGGFIVSYSPHIPQVVDFVNDIKKDDSFIYIRTIEIIERDWEIDGRKVRPQTSRIGHSGFLTFARLVKKN